MTAIIRYCIETEQESRGKKGTKFTLTVADVRQSKSFGFAVADSGTKKERETKPKAKKVPKERTKKKKERRRLTQRGKFGKLKAIAGCDLITARISHE